MEVEYSQFLLRLEAVKERIARACQAAGRRDEKVALLPVTKTLPSRAVDFVHRCGLPAVGENRVQEAAAKKPLCAGPLRWELIGHLQSNKAGQAAEIFDRIQSLDSEKLLYRLERALPEGAAPLAVLLQVNAGEDPGKFGLSLAEAPFLLDRARRSPAVRVEGLMAIAPLEGGREAARRCFARLRELREELVGQSGLPLEELSMGMSGDLEEAVREGSTQVRIGSALFGERSV